MNILVTGGAGFIGSHLIKRLLGEGHRVISVDNLSIEDRALQRARLEYIGKDIKNKAINITDFNALENVFNEHTFDAIYHIAAKPGVRESIENPFIYAQSNYIGTLNVFELAKRHSVPHVIFASSSSVYGKNTKMPFGEDDRVDEPISVYASSKRAGELLAYTYSHLFDMNITCLRFFTVYGPYGRPDMAPYIFTKKIIEGEVIDVYNDGNQKRDLTFISDIIDGCASVLEYPDKFSILNLGNGNPVELMKFIEVIESVLGVKAKKQFLSAQPGDVTQTYADVTKAHRLFGYAPKVNIEDGIKKYISWYRSHYDC